MSRSILVNEMTSSSEDDEQVSIEGSGSGSGSESESDMTTPPPPPPQPSSKITQSFSSEEAESESDMKTPPSPQPASKKTQSSSEEESESESDMKTPPSPQPASKKTQSSSEEESESESDMTTPPPPQPASKKTQYSSSEEESESESESEADLPPKKSVRVNPNTILLSPKPITSQKPRTENPDQSNSHSPLPVNRERKRKATEVENEATESKIAKTADVEKKPPMFQRVWSDGDEIALMEGMIRYVETTTKDPTENVNDFHQFVKNSLRIDVNIKQMRDKIRRLKEKFKKNVCVPHKKKMFELSDKLWGENSIRNAEEEADDQKLKGNNKPVVSGEAILNGVGVVHSWGGGIKIPITDEDIMNRGLEMVSGAQKEEVEKKWRDLKVNELEHYLKKLEVLKEQGEVVLNAIKKSGASC